MTILDLGLSSAVAPLSHHPSRKDEEHANGTSELPPSSKLQCQEGPPELKKPLDNEVGHCSPKKFEEEEAMVSDVLSPRKRQKLDGSEGES